MQLGMHLAVAFRCVVFYHQVINPDHKKRAASKSTLYQHVCSDVTFVLSDYLKLIQFIQSPQADIQVVHIHSQVDIQKQQKETKTFLENRLHVSAFGIVN